MTNPFDFSRRQTGPDEEQTRQMLQAVGAASLEELIDQTIPAEIRLKEPLHLPQAMTQAQYLAHFHQLASLNKPFKNYIGLGYYSVPMEPVIQRNIFENPAWYTSYTPYQAEISQGRLEALMNFQTMVALAHRTTHRQRFAARRRHFRGRGHADAVPRPQPRAEKGRRVEVFRFGKRPAPDPRRAQDARRTRWVSNWSKATNSLSPPQPDYFGMMLQYPTATGAVEDYRQVVEQAHQAGVKVVVAADILSLALLIPPGEWGADVAVGSTQRFGIPMGFGGPAAAYFATREEYKRELPGRIIGLSVDKAGRPALRMALQMREQHIKREKATSNICTASVLMAVMAGMYAVYYGPEGIGKMARHTHAMAVTLAEILERLGYRQLNASFFDTLLLHTGDDTERIREIAEGEGINFLYVDEDKVGITLSQYTSLAEMNRIAYVFAAAHEVFRDPVLQLSQECRVPSRAVAPIGFPHPEGVPELPQRDRNDALHQVAGAQGYFAHPFDDSAGFVYDEAQCGF